MKQLKNKKFLTIFCLLTVTFAGGTIGCNTKDVFSESPKSNSDILVLYTNDVHCGVNDNIGYDGLSEYKKELEKQGNTVWLVDSGDAIQGGIMGSMTKGKSIVEIMNRVGYNVAVPGNHEFDYGMENFLLLKDVAGYPYVSANFIRESSNSTVLQPYVILEAQGRKVAFIGATTPKTVTSSAPKYFQDEKGNNIYGFYGGQDGIEFYGAIQRAVNKARSEGADKCIVLAHLGIQASDKPYMSTDLIEHTTGIDAVLDGHSHSIVAEKKVKNAEGKEVLLTQTGKKLSAIGKLTISNDGSMYSELISDYNNKDNEITELIAQELEEYSEQLSEVLGSTKFPLVARTGNNFIWLCINNKINLGNIVADVFHSLISGNIDFLNVDSLRYIWLCRNNETNLGDFVADAFRYSMGTDIGFINGGGLRDNIEAGDITYSDVYKVLPFENDVCVVNATGQEIADALEYSVSKVPEVFGGFLQVSGISFDVDLNKKANIVLDTDGMFVKINGNERRVTNIKINEKPIDMTANYTVASIKYILQSGGNGYTMFKGERKILDRHYSETEVIANYIKQVKNIDSVYEDIYGQERIHFINK